jgi:ABC-type branched-subunit amino acid transport system substrate-binding protein
MYPKAARSLYDLQAYDAAMAIINAYARAIRSRQIEPGVPMTEGSRGLIALLVGHSRFTGATGLVSFDANGDIANHLFSIYAVQEPGNRPVWTYDGLAPAL